jgi:SNF2 family DNA or RNA helicase
MGTLRPYQKSALNWFIQAYDNSFGCILADDAKLGKKVQSLAFLAYLEEFSKINGPHLIVTDKSSNWIAAIERFLPYTTCVEYGEKIDNFNICLVDYETYFSDSFDGSFFQVQIIDQVKSIFILKRL